MDNKIKVLHVIGSLKIGGAENVAMNFSRYLDKQKFKCDYLVFNNEVGEYEKEAIDLGCKVIRIESPNKGYMDYVKNLKEVLKDNRYDVIHSHTLLNNGITLKVAYDMKIRKRISHSHSTDSGVEESLKYKIYKYFMKKMIKKYSTDIIACGEDAGNYLYGKKEFKNSGIIVNNGIDINKYSYNEEKRNESRKELGIENELVVGHVGRFTKVKNHDFLIDIFNEIYKYDKYSKLLLIGDGELREEIESKIRSLGLENNVILTGIRTDVSDLQQAIDVFVFPSLYEGLPVAMIEAQAGGIPCITSENVTQEVKITDSVEFMSLEKSPKDWANKIIEFRKKNRRDTSKDLILAGFDINSTIEEVTKIYE